MEKSQPPPYEASNEPQGFSSPQSPNYSSIPHSGQQYPAQYNPGQYQVPPPPQPPVYQIQGNISPSDMSMYKQAKKTIPVLPVGFAIACMVINCILPGFGTITASFGSLCCADYSDTETNRFQMFCINFWFGWMQFILIVFGIGWVWSVLWGVAFVQLAKNKGHFEEQTVVVIQGQNNPQ